MSIFIVDSAIKARGTADNPVSLRQADDGTLGLWSHKDNAFVDLTAPPEGVSVWLELPFEKLPPKAQEYVRVLSRIALNREQGSSPTYMAQLRDEAARLLRELQHEQTSTLRNNVANRASLQRKLLDIQTGGLYYRSRVPIR